MNQYFDKIDISLYTKEVGRIEPYSGYKMEVSLEGADMTDFLSEYENDILNYIGEQTLVGYLEELGYEVKEHI